MSNPTGPIALAITGASGSRYALRLLECLIRQGLSVYVMISKAARVVLSMESDLELPEQSGQVECYLSQHFKAAQGQLRVFALEEWTAPVASGSNPPQAMVVCPCTTGTLSAIANGASDNLIERAADVVIKEHKRLILVVRETPLSAIHLENMLKLARLGVVVMPASPGFYDRPQTLEQLLDFMVARVLDQLGVENDLLQRWG